MMTADRVTNDIVESAHEITLGDLLECHATHDEVISLLSNAAKALVADYSSLDPSQRELSAEIVQLNNSIDNKLRQKAFWRVRERRTNNNLR